MADDQRAPIPGLGQDPIGEAIVRLEARAHRLVEVRLQLLSTPHAWPIDADVTVAAPDNPKDPLLLLWDPVEAGWRVIVLPPGSAWRIRNAAATGRRPLIERIGPWIRQLLKPRRPS